MILEISEKALRDANIFILKRINHLNFKNRGFSSGDILAQAMIKRDEEEVQSLLELKEIITAPFYDHEGYKIKP